MTESKVQVLKRHIFPYRGVFKHLQDGARHYQNRDFSRAVEEWSAAKRLGFNEESHMESLKMQPNVGGFFSEIPFIFFISIIFLNRKSGIGVVKKDDISKKIVFKNGRMIFSWTSRKQERIGTFIQKRKNLSSQELETLVHQSQRQGTKLGNYLVEKGYISREVLHHILSLQIDEILSDIFFWETGRFYFIEKPVASNGVVNYSPLNFAQKAGKRWFDFTGFRKKIPSNKTIFRVSPYAEKDRDELLISLDQNSQFIFSSIDGKRNIDQLVQFSGADEVSVISTLYQLYSKGLIRQSKDIGEYKDQEFDEMKKVFEVLLEIYELIYKELFRELGIRCSNTIKRAQDDLDARFQLLFKDVPLENPERLEIKTILRNLATYFPAPNQRSVFINAFFDLFENMLRELKKFLGEKLLEHTIDRIKTGLANIERFATESSLKRRLLETLNRIAEI